ncbi:hypothetical protein D9M70_618730 [compost metagenome]
MVKDDQFTITSQVQKKDGWLLHPLNDELRQGKEDKRRFPHHRFQQHPQGVSLFQQALLQHMFLTFGEKAPDCRVLP